MALWKGVFTSISAFCNAGFFLHGSSLTPYAHDPWVLGFTSIAIMVGGLGPAVVAGLPQLLRGRGTLHGRLVIWTSLVLWIAPAVLIIALEWSHALAHLAPLDRVSNGIFHSVSLRTAGFNAIDLATVRPATWTILVICMFIGGSPGSTAGGAKTTTVALLVLAVLAAVRGQSEVSAFGRRIPHRSLYEATAVVSIGLASGVAVLFALQLTQAIPLDLLAFETVSALATVGLSTGATAQLDAVGKLIVMAAMFMGRVGPLSLFLVFADRQGRRVPGYPLESVQVG
jgi:trk system potassium uptake protein TrkH